MQNVVVRHLTPGRLLVHSKSLGRSEPLGTADAGEGPSSSVGEAVVPQVVRSPEPLVTLGAREGALIPMDSLVYLQVVAFGELSVTELADVPFPGSLGHQVGGGGGWEGEALAECGHEEVVSKGVREVHGVVG